MSLVGQMRTVLIAGRQVPGIIVEELAPSTVQVPSRDPARNGALVNIPVRSASIITLRETNPALGKVREYLTITPENLRFTLPRFDLVDGLDYDAKTGEKFSMEQIIQRTAESMSAYQTERANRAPAPDVRVALD